MKRLINLILIVIITFLIGNPAFSWNRIEPDTLNATGAINSIGTKQQCWGIDTDGANPIYMCDIGGDLKLFQVDKTTYVDLWTKDITSNGNFLLTGGSTKSIILDHLGANTDSAYIKLSADDAAVDDSWQITSKHHATIPYLLFDNLSGIHGAIKINSATNGSTILDFQENNNIMLEVAYTAAGNYAYFQNVSSPSGILKIYDAGGVEIGSDGTQDISLLSENDIILNPATSADYLVVKPLLTTTTASPIINIKSFQAAVEQSSSIQMVNSAVAPYLDIQVPAVGGLTTDTLKLTPTVIYPTSDNTVDLGITTTNEFKDLFLQGEMQSNSVDTTTVDIWGNTIIHQPGAADSDSGTLTFRSLGGATPPGTTAQDGVIQMFHHATVPYLNLSVPNNGDITLAVTGTGEVNIPKVDIDGGAIDAVTIGTNSPCTQLVVDTTTINGAVISDSTGAINFDNENLSGVGTVDFGGGTFDAVTSEGDITINALGAADSESGILTFKSNGGTTPPGTDTQNWTVQAFHHATEPRLMFTGPLAAAIYDFDRNVNLSGGSAASLNLDHSGATTDSAVLWFRADQGTSNEDFSIQAIHHATTPYLSYYATSAGAFHSYNISTALTNTSKVISRFVHTTSGDMADDFGPSLEFDIKDGTSGTTPIAYMKVLRSGADATGKFVFSPLAAGADTDIFNIMATGANGPIGAASPSTGSFTTVLTSGDVTIDHTGATSDSPILYLDADNATTAQNFSIQAKNHATDPYLNFVSPAGGYFNFDKNIKATSADFDNINIDGNTISSTDTNGNITLTPNGIGEVVAPYFKSGTNTGDFMAGTTLNTEWTSGNEYKMFYDSSNGYLASGLVTGTNLDNANRGLYSTSLGKNNKVSGHGSLAVGESNVVSGTAAFSTGYSNLMSGSWGMISALSGTNAYSLSNCFGRSPKARDYSEFNIASGYITAAGDAQLHRYVEFIATTDATPAILNRMINNAATVQAGFLIVDKSAYAFTARILAQKDDHSIQADYEIKGAIHRNGDTTTLDYSTVTVIYEADAAYDCVALADDTNERLTIQVTGKAATNLHWVASYDITESNY
jgi:hypothetical protein